MNIMVWFPDRKPNPITLGSIRKFLKQYAPGVHIRKRRDGVLVSGSASTMAIVQLLLLSYQYDHAVM